MNGNKPNPPTSAIWLLRHVCPGRDNDALTGDLLERFREGQTRGWFWKQVLMAFAVGIMRELRQHWPAFCYAIAGAAMPAILSNSVRGAGHWLHWSSLPWPLSQFVFELGPTAALALAALPVLAAGLAINGTFRWVSLLRTWILNLALITLGHYSTDFLPWLTRPVPGDPHSRYLVVPLGVVQVLFFFTFLVAAWLGCAHRELRRPALHEQHSS